MVLASGRNVVAWSLEISDEFERWWIELDEEAQIAVDAMLRVLEMHGSALGPPYALPATDGGAAPVFHLRVPHGDHTLWIRYLCDTWRATAVLLAAASGMLPAAVPGEHHVYAYARVEGDQ